MEELLKVTEENGGGFDIVFIDTFAEGYEGMSQQFASVGALILIISFRAQGLFRRLAEYLGGS